MEIKVEKHHIESGEPNNECKCPVTLAMKEATGIDWIVDEFELIDTKNKRIYDTPNIVRYFIRKFDSQVRNKKDNIYTGLRTFEPFKFYLPHREHSRYYFNEPKKYDGRSIVRKWGLV